MLDTAVVESARQESARYEWLKKADDTVIPMMPAVAHRVIELVSDPEVSIATIAALVSKDQVLASRVLGLANSAYCAPMQTVSTVLEAIVRLGTSAVRNVVVTVSFTSRMHDPRIYGDASRERADHAIGTAYVARLVAEKAGIDEDEAFLCGLLHDIGKLVVLKLAHDHGNKTGAADSAGADRDGDHRASRRARRHHAEALEAARAADRAGRVSPRLHAGAGPSEGNRGRLRREPARRIATASAARRTAAS